MDAKAKKNWIENVPRKPVDASRIVVQFVMDGPAGKNMVPYKMPSAEPLGNVMKAWSKRKEIALGSVRFFAGHFEVKPTNTASEFTLTNGVLVIAATRTATVPKTGNAANQVNVQILGQSSTWKVSATMPPTAAFAKVFDAWSRQAQQSNARFVYMGKTLKTNDTPKSIGWTDGVLIIDAVTKDDTATDSKGLKTAMVAAGVGVETASIAAAQGSSSSSSSSSDCEAAAVLDEDDDGLEMSAPRGAPLSWTVPAASAERVSVKTDETAGDAADSSAPKRRRVDASEPVAKVSNKHGAAAKKPGGSKTSAAGKEATNRSADLAVDPDVATKEATETEEAVYEPDEEDEASEAMGAEEDHPALLNDEDPDIALAALKAENDVLKARLLNEEDPDIARCEVLEAENAALKEEIARLKAVVENAQLRAEIARLKAATASNVAP